MVGNITLRLAAAMLLVFAAGLEAASVDHSTSVNNVDWGARG